MQIVYTFKCWAEEFNPVSCVTQLPPFNQRGLHSPPVCSYQWAQASPGCPSYENG